MATSLHEQRLSPLPLDGGGCLEAPVIGYCSLGTLNAEGTNAVLVLHGYTTGPEMLEAGASVAEGSWSELVGPVV
jgi:homoserine O-acetyltransferase